MVLLDQTKFLAELGKLFGATRDSGSLSITHKRLEDRAAKKRKGAPDDATAATDASADAPAAAPRHGVLIRARTEKKKLSVVVADADLVKFQRQLFAVVRAHASSLKKKDRSAKKVEKKAKG